MKNKYFKTLGLPVGADQKAIKSAYRKLAIKYHPDKNPTQAGTDKFVEIKEAYEILSNQTLPPKAKQYAYNDFVKQANKPKERRNSKLTEEQKKERIKEAKKRYEEQKRAEAQENDNFFNTISTGRRWKGFTVITLLCTLLSFIFIADFILPSKWETDYIVKTNQKVAYNGLIYKDITPFKTASGNSFWTQRKYIHYLTNKGEVQVQRSFWLKDLQAVWFRENNGKLVKTETDFSVVGSFPIIPLILLIPLITFLLKGKTLTYSFLFHVSLYVFGTLAFILLVSEDRWLHLITFGML